MKEDKIFTVAEIRVLSVCSEHSTGRAIGEALGMAQPTVLVTLQRIEEKLGFPIFIKGKGRAASELTPNGILLSEVAKAVFKEILEINVIASELPKEEIK